MHPLYSPGATSRIRSASFSQQIATRVNKRPKRVKPDNTHATAGMSEMKLIILSPQSFSSAVNDGDGVVSGTGWRDGVVTLGVGVVWDEVFGTGVGVVDGFEVINWALVDSGVIWGFFGGS